MDINIYMCLQANIYVIEWISKDFIFIVIVEQYLLRSRRKWLPKTCLHSLFFMYVSFGEEKKDRIYSLYRFDFILVLKCLLICCVLFEFLLENLFACIETPTAAPYGPSYCFAFTSFDWLVVHCYRLRSIILHSYGDVIIISEGLQNVILWARTDFNPATRTVVWYLIILAASHSIAF